MPSLTCTKPRSSSSSSCLPYRATLRIVRPTMRAGSSEETRLARKAAATILRPDTPARSERAMVSASGSSGN